VLKELLPVVLILYSLQYQHLAVEVVKHNIVHQEMAVQVAAVKVSPQ
jgi:hypothetical protein